MATETCPACVLLIEDDERLRETIGAFLESRDYTTVLAEDGAQALDLLGVVQRPCLVLIDLLTLKMDVEALFASLTPHDRVATLPMVLVSVSAPGLLSRPVAVKKPVDFELLFRIVQDHCCSGAGGGGRALGGRGRLFGE